MSAIRIILIIAGCLFYVNCTAQGTTYSNSIVVPMDGVVRNYSNSGSTGPNVICSTTGTTYITWFSFTTNGLASCPLLNITASDSLPVEIAMYNSISGNINNNLEAGSSMCFDDGFGLWAPAETFIVSAGKTYYLRIKTETACSIMIAGQHVNPSNDDCTGAFSINTSAIKDNNACHTPGPDVSPDQLCAFTLENTAFYQFYVASTGNSIINISDISCDNGGINNSSGFQIGFFTGTCPFLVPLSCTSGSGNFVQATSPPLPSGTKVYVAIDGNGGSNCSYSISGVNVTGVLGTNFKNFSAWIAGKNNRLSWKIAAPQGYHIYIERSANGREFETINQVETIAAHGEEEFYSVDDVNPPDVAFYRLKIVSGNNRINYSVVREIRRGVGDQLTMKFQNPIQSNFNGSIESPETGPVEIVIRSMSGQLIKRSIQFCQKGTNSFNLSLASLSMGRYQVSLTLKESKFATSFTIVK